jgi:hypothetical protein
MSTLNREVLQALREIQTAESLEQAKEIASAVLEKEAARERALGRTEER